MNEKIHQLALSIANDLAAAGREDILKEALCLLTKGDLAGREARERLRAEKARSKSHPWIAAIIRLPAIVSM